MGFSDETQKLFLALIDKLNNRKEIFQQLAMKRTDSTKSELTNSDTSTSPYFRHLQFFNFLTLF